MTNEDLWKLAEQAGFKINHRMIWVNDWEVTPYLQRFAALVAESEREQCAQECELLRPSKPEYDQRFYDGCTLSAAAIRARSQS